MWKEGKNEAAQVNYPDPDRILRVGWEDEKIN